MSNYKRYDCPRSSVIDYVSYQHADELLNVKFKSGGVYTYRGVSKNRFTRLCNSESIGRYFHEFVKNKYPVVGPRNFNLERELNSVLLDSVEVTAPSCPYEDGWAAAYQEFLTELGQDELSKATL